MKRRIMNQRPCFSGLLKKYRDHRRQDRARRWPDKNNRKESFLSPRSKTEPCVPVKEFPGNKKATENFPRLSENYCD
jgi:hypothetical protein